jgi:hypothetical protein
MMRTLGTLWRLLRTEPTVSVMLLCLYVFAGLIAWLMEPRNRGMAVAFACALPALGFAASLSHRIERASVAAGHLGVPAHEKAMRQVQIAAALLFVLVPVLGSFALGADLLTASTIIAGSFGAGLLIAMYRRAFFFLFVGSYLFSSRRETIAEGLFGLRALAPVLKAAAIAAAALLFIRWLSLPGRVSRLDRGASFADSAHESLGLDEPDDSSEQGMNGAAADRGARPAHTVDTPDPLKDALRDIVGRTLSPRALALGLGYPLATNWRLVAIGTAFGAVLLAAWRGLRGGYPGSLAYLILTATSCMGALGRFEMTSHAWRRRVGEQEILKLTPRWPDSRRIKELVVLSVTPLWRGTLAGWMALSVLALAFDWIDGREIAIAAIGVAAVCCLSSASLWAMLARRKIPRIQLLSVAIALIEIVGAALLGLGDPLGPLHLLYGAVLMLAPPALALTWYLRAPLRFPVQADDFE